MVMLKKSLSQVCVFYVNSMKIIFINFVIYAIIVQCSEATFEQLGNYLQPATCIQSNGSFSYLWDSPIGPDCWPATFPQCAGRLQSPINIDTYHANRVYTTKRIACSKWIEKAKLIHVKNTGKTIQLKFEYTDGGRPILSPRPITQDQFQFDSAHIHFIGSEHSFNLFQKYSMEAHLIFFNAKYMTRENAENYRDGLIVVAKFYKLQYGVDADFTFMRKVEEVEDEIRLTHNRVFSLEDVFGPININFYTYSGSLSTPGCNEVVTFVLDDTPLKISIRTLKILSHIRGAEGYMSPNIRPTQPTNGRKIYYYRKQ